MKRQTLLLLSALLFSLFAPSDFNENAHTPMNWQQYNLVIKLLAELRNSVMRFIKVYTLIAWAEITVVVMPDFTVTL